MNSIPERISGIEIFDLLLTVYVLIIIFYILIVKLNY